MKITELSFRKKLTLLFVAIAVLVVLIAATLGILYGTVESRVEGLWESDPLYVDSYGCVAVKILSFEESNVVCVTINPITEKILNYQESTVRDISGSEILVHDYEGRIGSVVYEFHPFLGKLTCGDWTFSKATE